MDRQCNTHGKTMSMIYYIKRSRDFISSLSLNSMLLLRRLISIESGVIMKTKTYHSKMVTMLTYQSKTITCVIYNNSITSIINPFEDVDRMLCVDPQSMLITLIVKKMLVIDDGDNRTIDLSISISNNDDILSLKRIDINHYIGYVHEPHYDHSPLHIIRVDNDVILISNSIEHFRIQCMKSFCILLQCKRTGHIDGVSTSESRGRCLKAIDIMSAYYNR